MPAKMTPRPRLIQRWRGCVRFRRCADAEPDEQQCHADHAAEQRQGQHVGARVQHELAQHVAGGEHRGGEDARAEDTAGSVRRDGRARSGHARTRRRGCGRSTPIRADAFCASSARAASMSLRVRTDCSRRASTGRAERVDERAARIALRSNNASDGPSIGASSFSTSLSENVGVFRRHGRPLGKVWRKGVGGVAADHHAPAKPRPRQHHRLDRAVDDVGLAVQRCGDFGDVAAVWRRAAP